MAIGAIGGGTPVTVPQAAEAVAPAAAPAAGGVDATQQAIDENMAMEQMGQQGIMQLGMDVQQEAQKIEQKNQARAKEMLQEAKKDG